MEEPKKTPAYYHAGCEDCGKIHLVSDGRGECTDPESNIKGIRKLKFMKACVRYEHLKPNNHD